MMARSTTRSNLRPDTLMQDRICQVDETSCNARPDHTFRSKTEVAALRRDVCFTPTNRHRRARASVPGQKRKSRPCGGRSALNRRTDIGEREHQFRKVPILLQKSKIEQPKKSRKS